MDAERNASIPPLLPDQSGPDRIQKVWGYETHLVRSPLYTLKRMVCKQGYQSSIHYHLVKDETFLVEKGILVVETVDPLQGELGQKSLHYQQLWPGDRLHIPPGVPHRFRCHGQYETVTFLEVSTHDDPEDNYRLTQSGPM